MAQAAQLQQVGWCASDGGAIDIVSGVAIDIVCDGASPRLFVDEAALAEAGASSESEGEGAAVDGFGGVVAPRTTVDAANTLVCATPLGWGGGMRAPRRH